MVLSNLSLIKAPFKVYKIEPTIPFNKKYALKYLDHLLILDKTRSNEITRYLKRVYRISGDAKNIYKIDPEIFNKTKRLSKSCKVSGSFDPKALPLSFSPVILSPTNLFDLPLSFKLGVFKGLILEMETPPHEKFPTEAQVSQYLFKLAQTLNNLKLLQGLAIVFKEKTLDITTHFLLELQKAPQKLTSLRTFQLHYKGTSTADLNRLPNDLTPSITYLSFEINQIDPFTLKPQEFPKLTYLSFMINAGVKNSSFNFFTAFKDLPNLETFVFKCSDNTCIEIVEFVQAFQLPKSVKNVSLILKIDFEKYVALVLSKLKISQEELTKVTQQKESLLFKLMVIFKWKKWTRKLQHAVHNSFEEFACFEEFYEKWKELDKLCNLTLNISSPPKCQGANFFFVVPILKRCKNLTKLSLKCGDKALVSCCQIDYDVDPSVGWEQIYNTLEPSKDTLQYLNLEVCSVNFEKKNPPHLIFKNLKHLDLCIHATKPQYLQKILNIIPPEEEPKAKVPRKFRLSVDAGVWNKRDLKQLLNGIKNIPRNLNFRLGSFLDGFSEKTYKKRMLDFVSSAQIEGNLRLDLSGIEINSIELRSFLNKLRNRSITGSLSIRDYHSEEVKFQIKKERFLDDFEF